MLSGDNDNNDNDKKTYNIAS